MTRTWSIVALGALAFLHATSASTQEFSLLWGEDGAAWEPAGRLPDFSFAGYRCGEDPIPDVPEVDGIWLEAVLPPRRLPRPETEAVSKRI